MTFSISYILSFILYKQTITEFSSQHCENMIAICVHAFVYVSVEYWIIQRQTI